MDVIRACVAQMQPDLMGSLAVDSRSHPCNAQRNQPQSGNGGDDEQIFS